MRSSTLLPVIATLAATVLADVKFTSPAPGASIPAGTLTVKWEESGDTPKISDLSTYTLQLMVGGNTDASSVGLLSLSTKGSHAQGTTAQGTVPANIAGTLKNGFYLKMISTAKEGGTVTNFSGRFSIEGLTGTTAANAVTGAQAVTGTDGPDTIDNVANDAAAAAPAAGAGDDMYGIAYADQSGLTKYAPMQGVPPTKITAQNFSPKYPTSSVSIATTWLPKPTVQTTMTQTQTFSVSSMENTAAPQAGPSGDMQKFLNRWKD
ncbi:Cell wall synthesis protein [Sphaerulina musiva]